MGCIARAADDGAVVLGGLDTPSRGGLRFFLVGCIARAADDDAVVLGGLDTPSRGSSDFDGGMYRAPPLTTPLFWMYLDTPQRGSSDFFGARRGLTDPYGSHRSTLLGWNYANDTLLRCMTSHAHEYALCVNPTRTQFSPAA